MAHVSRFIVMALLQAARAHILGLPLDSAYSWGLNRSIFYAAAKRGFKGGGAASAGRAGAAPTSKTADTYFLGDEMAYRAGEPGELLFTIGGKVQTGEDFKRQIESRFQGRFKDAWEDAVDYVSHFDRETLLSGSSFFSSVYRPKRDEFASKWTEMSGEGKEAPATGRKPVKASQSARRLPSGRKRSS